MERAAQIGAQHGFMSPKASTFVSGARDHPLTPIKSIGNSLADVDELCAFLRDKARVNDNILKQTMDKLRAEEVFEVEDLQHLRKVDGLGDIFSRVTASKVADALDALAALTINSAPAGGAPTPSQPARPAAQEPPTLAATHSGKTDSEMDQTPELTGAHSEADRDGIADAASLRQPPPQSSSTRQPAMGCASAAMPAAGQEPTSPADPSATCRRADAATVGIPGPSPFASLVGATPAPRPAPADAPPPAHEPTDAAAKLRAMVAANEERARAHYAARRETRMRALAEEAEESASLAATHSGKTDSEMDQTPELTGAHSEADRDGIADAASLRQPPPQSSSTRQPAMGCASAAMPAAGQEPTSPADPSATCRRPWAHSMILNKLRKHWARVPWAWRSFDGNDFESLESYDAWLRGGMVLKFSNGTFSEADLLESRLDVDVDDFIACSQGYRESDADHLAYIFKKVFDQARVDPRGSCASQLAAFVSLGWSRAPTAGELFNMMVTHEAQRHHDQDCPMGRSLEEAVARWDEEDSRAPKTAHVPAGVLYEEGEFDGEDEDDDHEVDDPDFDDDEHDYEEDEMSDDDDVCS